MVLQALRYHFISMRAIKILIIVVNIFALFAALMFYMKLVSPLPFLMSSVLWISTMTAFWFWLPALIYKRSKTFQDHFNIGIEDQHFFVETSGTTKTWAWRELHRYYETPGFFHLYFDANSFFLIPKEAFTLNEDLEYARKIFRNNIRKS